MSSRTTKRFRKNDDANQRTVSMDSVDSVMSNSADSKDDPEFTHTIPTLVAELFLRNLRNISILKTCRLVCKSWNFEACKSLRVFSKVTLEESSSRFNDFSKFIVTKSLGRLQHLPSPFQNFHVQGSTLTDPTFIEFVLNIPITGLILQVDDEDDGPALNQQQLRNFLAANKANITNLEISTWLNRRFEFDKNSANDAIELACLKRLKLQDICCSCNHIQFWQNILNTCKPECLDLYIRDKDSVNFLLPQDKAEHLKKLELSLRKISRKSWNHLGNLKFVGLKSLSFRTQVSVSTLDEDDIRQWRSFCRNVSPVLEEFESNLTICWEPEMIFPNLKSIEFQKLNDDKNLLSSLTPCRFPSLVKVIIGFRMPVSIIVENEIPHRGVASLDLLAINLRFEENDSINEDLILLLTNMSRQFPKVSSLKLSISTFFRTTLPDIFESFPKLTTLTLDGNCDFSCLAGMSESTVAEYLERGLPIEKIPRRKSITDFMELHTINFGSQVTVDPFMIRHCLPRVPKLRQINFCWNKDISGPLLRDSIGHLQRIFYLTGIFQCMSLSGQDRLLYTQKICLTILNFGRNFPGCFIYLAAVTADMCVL
ncbi:unnamed protein product, partial [Allacma fusca]